MFHLVIALNFTHLGFASEPICKQRNILILVKIASFLQGVLIV